jgi:hypothetical protein
MPPFSADPPAAGSSVKFELLRHGSDLRTIVVTARVHPRVVRSLYSEWLVSLREGEQARRDAQYEREHLREEREHAREHRSPRR